jgi:hypothetical protein
MVYLIVQNGSDTLPPPENFRIMARGNEGNSIFVDDDDRLFFLDILEAQLLKTRYLLYARCLVHNHSAAGLVRKGGDERCNG